MFASSIVTTKIPNIYHISSSIQYLIYFYIGYIFSRNIEQFIEHLKKYNLIYFTTHFILFNINYFLINNMNIQNILYKVSYLILNKIIAIIGIVYLFSYLIKLFNNNDKIIKIKKNKLYNFIDKHNFNIYLIHQPIMLSLIAVVKMVNINPVVLYLLLFGLTLILLVMISVVVVKFKNYSIKSRKEKLKLDNI